MLTALRGVAAYLVVLSHCQRLVEQSCFGEPGSASALRFLDAGSFGVVVFFALSGCTLYTSYGRQPLTRDSVAASSSGACSGGVPRSWFRCQSTGWLTG